MNTKNILFMVVGAVFAISFQRFIDSGPHKPLFKKESPVEKLGLKSDDIIYSVAGEKISNFEQIQGILKRFRKGDTVEILFLRNPEKMKTNFVLSTKPEENNK